MGEVGGRSRNTARIHARWRGTVVLGRRRHVRSSQRPASQEAASGSRYRQRLITGAEVCSKGVLETAVLSVAGHEDPARFDSCSS